VLIPNGNSCNIAGAQEDIYTAMSEHGDGVHVLFGDGNARWVSNSISRDVWVAFGSRNGREMSTGSPF
jgi:prepilin-type processing-associated H-X9-DG protein